MRGVGKVSGLAERPQRFSARYGARHPWLVPWPRAGLYLIWRGLVAGLRPFFFLGLLGVSVVAAVLTAQALPRSAPVAAPLEDRIDLALYRALDERRDRHDAWAGMLDAALQTSGRSMPDIVQARSVASAYVAFRGHDTLAIELLSDGRHPRHIESELRAMPVWLRARRLRGAIDAARAQGAERGFAPEELVFAPHSVQLRLRRANALYAPTFLEAERWFVQPDGRALALEALPGLSPRITRIYDDVRDVVVQGCAVAAQSGRATGQCRVGFLPKPASDPIMAGLALAVAGSEPERRAGARLAKVAWAAGVLDRNLAERLVLGPDTRLGEASVMASATTLMVDAGEVWTQPLRFEQAARSAAIEAARSANIDQSERDELFDSFTALRREVGAVAAIRLLAAVRSGKDAKGLVRVAEVSDGKLLALYALTGPDILDEVGGLEPSRQRDMSIFEWPRRAQQFLAISILAGLLALGLLLISLWQGHLRKQGRAPGVLERIDAAMSRLILGRNL